MTEEIDHTAVEIYLGEGHHQMRAALRTALRDLRRDIRDDFELSFPTVLIGAEDQAGGSTACIGRYLRRFQAVFDDTADRIVDTPHARHIKIRRSASRRPSRSI